MRNFRHLTILSLFLISYSACKDDMNSEGERGADGKPLSIAVQGARDYFEKYVAEVNLSEEMAGFYPGNFAPDWSKAVVAVDGSHLCVNVPIVSDVYYEGSYSITYDSAGVQKEGAPYTAFGQKLLVVKEPDKEYGCYLITIIPDKDNVTRSSSMAAQMYNNGDRNAKFSGTTLFTMLGNSNFAVAAERYLNGECYAVTALWKTDIQQFKEELIALLGLKQLYVFKKTMSKGDPRYGSSTVDIEMPPPPEEPKTPDYRESQERAQNSLNLAILQGLVAEAAVNFANGSSSSSGSVASEGGGSNPGTGTGAGSTSTPKLNTPKETPADVLATKIFDHESNLTTEQWIEVEKMIDRIMKDCVGGELFKNLAGDPNNPPKKIKLVYEPTMVKDEGQILIEGSMTALKVTIKLKSLKDESILFHEMFHACQIKTVTQSSAFESTKGNFEAEARLADFMYINREKERLDETAWDNKYKFRLNETLYQLAFDLFKKLDSKGQLKAGESIEKFKEDFYSVVKNTGYSFDGTLSNEKNLSTLQKLSGGC